MATVSKSQTYYVTRAAVRAVVKISLLMVAYAVLHVAAVSVWNALLFAAVVGCGFLIYSHRTKQSEQN